MCSPRPLLAVAALALAPAALAQAPAEPPVNAPPDARQPPAAQERASAADVPALVARADALWGERDAPGKLEELKTALTTAERAAPGDYGVLWRLARLYFWISDDPSLSSDEKSRLGKQAWEYGDRAAAVNPKGVEGWYFAATGMGNYSLGIGVLTALAQGIEGKFKERLSKAEAIDPNFFGGGIFNAWGRFYYKLPWPKYDARKSEQMLRKALRVNPDNVRGRVYLAELYVREGHPKEARKLLQEALAHAPGAYDAPEERRAQRLAQQDLDELK